MVLQTNCTVLWLSQMYITGFGFTKPDMAVQKAKTIVGFYFVKLIIKKKD